MFLQDIVLGPCLVCFVTQSCPTLCDPMDCSQPVSSVHGASPGKNIGVGCPALLQGFFPTQGSDPGLLPCRWILHHLRHQGSLSQSYTYLFIRFYIQRHSASVYELKLVLIIPRRTHYYFLIVPCYSMNFQAIVLQKHTKINLQQKHTLLQKQLEIISFPLYFMFLFLIFSG